ncbi:glycogen synthase [Streptomyces sp. NPDC002004]
MRVALLTREYPPEIYGGAGVHVDQLVRHLRHLTDVDVHCFGAPRTEPGVFAHPEPETLRGANGALRAMGVELAMAQAAGGADVVHSHTWYAGLAGHLAKLLHGVPHVVTTHSLEPLRPWKAEQLGGGYELSTFSERTALLGADRVVAVSSAMRKDVLRCYPELDPERVTVIRNGIDTGVYRPDEGTDELTRLGIRTETDDVRHTVVCIGRLTRQKGLIHLLRAAPRLLRGTQLVMAVSAPDTPEIDREFAELAAGLREEGCDLVWIRQQLSLRAVRQLLTFADVFACPSVYEPLGLVNLEAMACGTPVVATATGGIPEVVDDGVTGLLVPIAPDDSGTGDPVQPEMFAKDFADRINTLLADPDKAARMGKNGRKRAEREFTWSAVAEQTHTIYTSIRNPTPSSSGSHVHER